MVLAPEHPFVERLTQPEQAAAVKAYVEQACAQERPRPHRSGQRQDGRVHRLVRGESRQSRPVPIWIADYVLASYGTGAIMAVPAGDTRDFEFAVKFNLPIVPVIDPGDNKSVKREAVLAGKEVFTEEGTAINSGEYDGLATAEMKAEDHSRSRQARHGPPGGQLQAARLALQPAALLGRAVSDPARTGRRRQANRADAHGRCQRAAGRTCPTWPTSIRTAVPNRRWKSARGMALPGDRRQALQARNEHHAAVGRLVLVLPAVSGSEKRAGADRPGRGKSLDAGRHLHRRGRARGAAPAVRAVLAQGAVRPRLCQHGRAVSEAGQPGHDPGRDGTDRLSDRKRPVDQRRAGGGRRRRQGRTTKPRASRSAPCG